MIDCIQWVNQRTKDIRFYEVINETDWDISIQGVRWKTDWNDGTSIKAMSIAKNSGQWYRVKIPFKFYLKCLDEYINKSEETRVG